MLVRLIGIALLGLSLTLVIGTQRARAGEAPPLFPDKALDAAVREFVIEKKNTDKPLVEADVANLSTVVGKNKGIKSIAGLEKCKRLASLDLEGNEIADVAPLKDLKILQQLILPKNKIKDVAPLSGLTDLQYLDLVNNEVEDIAALKPLTRLTTLYLSNNKLADASVCGEMKRLWSLYLDGNKITDIAFVKELKWLSSLGLAGNGVSDLKPLLGLTELKFLFLEKNKVTDLAVLLAMAQKDQKEMRFSPYWQVYLHGNPLSATAKSKQLPALRKLGGKIVVEAPSTAPASVAPPVKATGKAAGGKATKK